MENDARLTCPTHSSNSDPRHLDGMRNVDVEELVVRGSVAILPEGVGRRFVHACAWNHNIGSGVAKFLIKDIEYFFKLYPVRYVSLVVQDFGPGSTL